MGLFGTKKKTARRGIDGHVYSDSGCQQDCNCFQNIIHVFYCNIFTDFLKFLNLTCALHKIINKLIINKKLTLNLIKLN